MVLTWRYTICMFRNIPSTPANVYKNKGWVSWGDWLGTNTVATQYKIYLSFEEAREFTQSLKLKNQQAWFDYCKSGNKPDNIPRNVHVTYKNDGWISMVDFLGIYVAVQ